MGRDFKDTAAGGHTTRALVRQFLKRLQRNAGFSADADHEGRGVVPSGCLYGRLDQLLCGRELGRGILGFTQDFSDLIVKETVDDAVATDQDLVFGLNADGPHLGGNVLVAIAKGALDDIAARV